MKNTIEFALQSQELKYQVLRDASEQKIIKLGIQLKNTRFDTFIDIRPEAEQVLIFAICPTLVPENKRNQISEFITRANYGLIIGNFEFDHGDGELRYKASYFYDSTFPDSAAVFLKNLYTSFGMMERYLPGIMAVIYGNLTPEAAVSQVERTSKASDN